MICQFTGKRRDVLRARQMKDPAFSLCLAEYGIGVLICGFTISTFIKSMLTTSRSTTMLASSDVATGSIKNLLIPKYFFDELAAVFMPAASSRVTAFFSSTNWFSMQAYIPVFGFGMCFASFLKTKFRDEDFKVPYPTLNIGSIHGGDATNRVCGQCEIRLDIRPIRDSSPESSAERSRGKNHS